jgi:glycyl-tRNA synthetase beta chain
MSDFLLEIGTEEIPARMIDAASAELRERVIKLLDRERLSAVGAVSSFDTPRRLAVLVSGVPEAQPDVTEQLTGPSASIAFKNGEPTPAAHAFAKKAGLKVSELARVPTPKGEYLAATVTRKGRPTEDVLAEFLPKEVHSIYWPKNMYWRKSGELFVRPVRWLVALLDGRVVPLEMYGIVAGQQSRGHRLLQDGAVTIPHAGKAYVDSLRAAKVLNRDERENQIRKSLDAATRSIAGARWREDKNLLDTVVNLTEFPSAILGSFDAEFLSLPEEVLVTVMRDHQKYFAVEDAAGKLLPHFLAVLNTEGDPEGIIRHGHERVLRARFNDARFFWDTDQKRSLLDRLDSLRNVTFQKDLGSYYEKTLRVQRLCSWLSEIVKQNGTSIRPGVIHKAVCLAKSDLTTELVKEFTELQGIVGGLYARAQTLDAGLPESTRFAIADAIYDQYKPGSVEGEAPRSIEGAVLSLGDKADTIAGMFALGLIPSGSKDPFALRRQANGMVKILAEYKLPLRLSEILQDARTGYRDSAAEARFSNPRYSESVREFFRERLQFYLREVRGFRYDLVNAVLAAGDDDVVDALARAEAVDHVLHMPEFAAIAAASKRMRNILRQATEKKVRISATFEYLQEADEEEKTLAAYMALNGPRIEQLRVKKDYKEALFLLSTVRERVDAFFDKVMVMADDEKLRANRLALLAQLLKEFSTIADFSEIVIEGTDVK